MTAAADVTLLLEGTYPYVAGGVSSWVHQIISGLPEVVFDLVFVGGRRADYGKQRYELPRNVRGLQTHYLEDALRGGKAEPVTQKSRAFEAIPCFHAALQDPSTLAESSTLVDSVLRGMATKNGVQLRDFMYGDLSFEFIREQHLAKEESAFLDYFWTLRLQHGPLFQLAALAESIPDSHVFHAVSTGYAGFLGALLAVRRHRPLVLTEHGIYTKERRIDLNKAEWLETFRPQGPVSLAGQGGVVRALWVRFFETLGRLTYRAANPIISLYGGNQTRQEQDGADPERTRVIVNGIQVGRFAEARLKRPATAPKIIALVGRVVPVKDVKTFARMTHLMAKECPTIEAWVVGGEDEDPGYAKECRDLVKSLGLQDKVRFLGHQNVVEILPRVGLLVLTSISEAQPLSVLEAFAAGVPCVTTDVGACRELIEGREAADRALGKAGRVAPFADATALANAALTLLRDPHEYASCQRAAVARVERYYSDTDMLAAYRNIYAEMRGH